MKTIKILFVAALLSSTFIACEADNINEEVGVEVEDIKAEGEDTNGETDPMD